MKTIARRLHRLEDQLGPADGKSRERLRLVVMPAGVLHPGLEGATCQRSLCRDGTLSECVRIKKHNDGPELTPEEFDNWVASFPVYTL